MIPNTINRHAIIVGAVTSLASLVLILFEISTVSYLSKIDGEDSKGGLFLHVGFIIFAVLLAFASGQMIFAVVKNRPLFMLPWLILMTLASVPFIIGAFIVFIHLTSYHYNGFLVFFVITGLDVILLFPIYGLFIEMYRENAGNNNFTSIVEDNNSSSRVSVE